MMPNHLTAEPTSELCDWGGCPGQAYVWHDGKVLCFEHWNLWNDAQFNGRDKPRGHKYGAQATDGYPSKAQARRAQELKLMERAGEIRNLKEEVPFPLEVNGVKVATYRADFTYEEKGDGPFSEEHLWLTVVEDVKSIPTKTPIYRLKKKLMKAIYGIEIKETAC